MRSLTGKYKTRASHEEDEGHFWPGYVDALVNVVMNLLFLLAIFAITFLVISSLKSSGGNETTPIQIVANSQGQKKTGSGVGNAVNVSKSLGKNYVLYEVAISDGISPIDLTHDLLSKYVEFPSGEMTIASAEIWSDALNGLVNIRRQFFFIGNIINFVESKGVDKKKITTRMYSVDGGTKATTPQIKVFILLKGN
jgi:hypothetical protein